MSALNEDSRDGNENVVANVLEIAIDDTVIGGTLTVIPDRAGTNEPFSKPISHVYTNNIDVIQRVFFFFFLKKVIIPPIELTNDKPSTS